MIQASPEEQTRETSQLIQRHLVEGWGTLGLFVTLGALLEILLAFKVSWYVRADQETLRLMWRLAHAHGTLLGLLNLGFAATLPRFVVSALPRPAGLISGCLSAATLLIPGGFFLGGLGAERGDPGALVAMVPMGAVFLLSAILLTLMQLMRRS